MSSDEVDLLKWPAPLPAAWQAEEVPAPSGWHRAYRVTEDGRPAGEIRVAFMTATPVAAAYPAGVRDRLMEPDAGAGPQALQLVSEIVMAGDPACRRLVVAAGEGDVEDIARAEAAGYRYVVDVDVPGRSLSLMVAEPDWVLEESRNLDDVPTQ